ncbi:unnamed protein product [Tilletia controversa]|uniref:Nucleolar 27S pre-rRNA processing Urb2/Npa2 C-terminal domain-containing protein n=3 Tax=Tilletia TaxID=13289 RepID=A0A8X7MTU8_9BASI|nr:hypothetical protein CF336_g3864 [Tilletia laevis]KAE8198574.1 hypothetical protein CF328_g3511 [Tilletia controversa]KAE8261509.1 hypothetical protein A4X03_0g3193 [Tilletia caries]KAE8203407.1 hypothetical protein CF335_g3028 [Tilletia laevis]KAE8247682.1 hypothetical protein A4X06_0g4271 [Tilletia controversa]
MPSSVKRNVGNLETVGIRTSEQLIKALKAPTDPPSGLKFSKIEIATFAAQANDSLSIPDRHLLLANWILELLSQSAKGKASSLVEPGRLWILLDVLLSADSKHHVDLDAIKKLASQHPAVSILTAFARRDVVSGKELMSCSRAMARLFSILAMKSASNNFDQINKCLEACLAAVPHWIAVDEGAASSILSEILSCWSLACVHSSNLKKASKFFLGDMYAVWVTAVQKARLSLQNERLATIIIDFGVVALLTDDTLRPYCVTAAEILEGTNAEAVDSSAHVLIATVIKSLQLKDETLQQASLQVLPTLLAQLVGRLVSNWPVLAPESITSAISGPLQQQLYVACLHSAVRRRFLDPIADCIRKSSPTGSSVTTQHLHHWQAEARRMLLQQVYDLGMFSTATADEEAWRSAFAHLLNDVVEDVRFVPAEGFISLDLLWQLDPTGMEKDSVRVLTLIADHEVAGNALSSGFQAARILVQHIVEHFSRTREIPRFCALLCDAAEAATGVSDTQSLLNPTSALASEGCASVWGSKLRGFLVPNQVAVIVEHFVVRSQVHCEAVGHLPENGIEADFDRSSTKRRRVQGKGQSTPRSSIDVSGAKGDAVAQKATAFFSMSSIMFRYLPAQESSATSTAQGLTKSIAEILIPTALKLLSQLRTSGSAIRATASLSAALIQCLSSITSFYEELAFFDISALPTLPRFPVHDYIDAATNKLPGDLRLSLLEAGLINAEQAMRDPSSQELLARQSHLDLNAMILQCLSTDATKLRPESSALPQATCQMLLSRWIPLLEILFDFNSLIDLADRALAAAATDEELMRRLISDARSNECATFLAAVCTAILQRLENLDGSKGSDSTAVVLALVKMDVMALPPPVRSALFKAVIKADFHIAKAKEQDQERVNCVLRRFIAELLNRDAPTDLQQSCAEWLSKVALGNGDTWSGPLQAATINAAVVIVRHLVAGSTEAEGSASAPLAFLKRTQTAKNTFGKRLSRNIATVLKSSSMGVDLSDEVLSCGSKHLSADTVQQLAGQLGEATQNEKTLLDIFDTLQSLQLLRRSTKAAPELSAASLAYGEAVVRFLSGHSQHFDTSDTVAAVAFELLRVGWSISSDSEAADNFSRLARWVSSLLASPNLEKWSSALRSEVTVRVRESFAVSEYETSLQSLEESLDSLLLVPGKETNEASAVLFTMTLFLCNGPEGTGKTARAAFDRVVSGLLALPIRSLQGFHPSVLVAVVDMLESVCRQKAVLLRVSETMAVIDLCTRLVSPSVEDFRPTQDAAVTIYSGIVSTLTALVRQRQDILVGMMPSLTAVICHLITLLRSVPSDLGSKLLSAGHAGSAPAWLDLSKGSLGPTEADLLSRLFLSITARTASLPVIARQKKRGVDGEALGINTTTTSLARPFAKHAIHVLVAYCRMLNAPLSTTDANVRKALRPGLFALCDIVKNHERDAAMVSSLGPAEQVVFKDLWSRWEKQRYRGE